MGWLKKKRKKLRKGIKKIGKKIGKAFKSILKPFAKVFNKLGPLGSMAMMFILPGIGQMMAGWGANMGNIFGTVIKHVGNAINFVATAPQKIFQTITGGIRAGWNAITNATTAGGDSWFTSFGKEFNKSWKDLGYDTVWKSQGVVAKVNDPGGLFKKGDLVGKGNFWDVSEQGQARIANFWEDSKLMGKDIKRVFKKDPNAVTLDDASVTGGDFYNEFLDPKTKKFNQGGFDAALEQLENKGSYGKFTLDRTGFFGNIKDVTSSIGDITVPGVGELRDVASVGSMALGAYSTLSQYGVIGSDDEVRGSSGMGLRAEEQLYAGDQGGIYNISTPTWSYDSSASTLQNQNNAMSAWNNNYGFPQGFDPSATPGYGFSYQQWLQEQMAA
jgi:hypothetical protein